MFTCSSYFNLMNLSQQKLHDFIHFIRKKNECSSFLVLLLTGPNLVTVNLQSSLQLCGVFLRPHGSNFQETNGATFLSLSSYHCRLTVFAAFFLKFQRMVSAFTTHLDTKRTKKKQQAKFP